MQAIAGAYRSDELQLDRFHPAGKPHVLDEVPRHHGADNAAMRDGRAVGRGAREFRIDVDRIEVGRHLGIGVDVLLDDGAGPICHSFPSVAIYDDNFFLALGMTNASAAHAPRGPAISGLTST